MTGQNTIQETVQKRRSLPPPLEMSLLDPKTAWLLNEVLPYELRTGKKVKWV